MHLKLMPLYFLFFFTACTPTEFKAHFIEKYVTNRNNLRLYTIFMPAHKNADTAPTIVWLHGFTKHCRRYIEPMAFMAERGFNSIALDVHGHGRSDGLRGHLESFDHCLHDIHDVYLAYKDKIKSDLFLVGHSLGGLAAIRHLEKFSDLIPFKAVIASSPCLLPHPNIIPSYKNTFARFASNFTPKYQVNARVKEERRACGAEVDFLLNEDNDPFVLDTTTLNGVASTYLACKDALQQAHQIKKPLHILAASNDDIVDFSKTMQFYKLIPEETPKSLTTYDTMSHALLHETDRHKVFNKMLDILVQYSDQVVQIPTDSMSTTMKKKAGSWYQSLKDTVSSWKNRIWGN